MSSANPEPQAIEIAPRTTPFHWLEGKEGLAWLLCTGLILLTGVLKSINLVIVLAYVLVALWVVNVLLAKRPLRAITARRGALPTITAGEPVAWNLAVTQPELGNGYWMLEEQAGSQLHSWLIPPSPSTDWHIRVAATFPQRGRQSIAPLLASSGFPFGLCRRTRELLPATAFIVLPQPARVDAELLQRWLQHTFEGRDEERRRVRRVVQHEAELHGLRDYRSGDPIRRIHWKATARRGKVTVREYEDSIPPKLLLIVDLWLPRDTEPEHQHNVEQTIALATGICREWRKEAGAEFSMLLCAQEARVLHGGSGFAPTQEMLEALALAEGTSQPDVLSLMGELPRPVLAAPVLVVSSRANSSVALAVRQQLNRPISVVDIEQPEAWFRLP